VGGCGISGRFVVLSPGGLAEANKGGTVAFHAVTSKGAAGLFVADEDPDDSSLTFVVAKIVDNRTAMPGVGGGAQSMFRNTEDQVMAMTPDGSRMVFFGSNDVRITDPDSRAGIFEWRRDSYAAAAPAIRSPRLAGYGQLRRLDEDDRSEGGTLTNIANDNTTAVPLDPAPVRFCLAGCTPGVPKRLPALEDETVCVRGGGGGGAV
jgi:hypothetical protein